MNGLAIIIVRLPSADTTTENIEELKLALNKKTCFYKNPKSSSKQLVISGEEKIQPR